MTLPDFLRRFRLPLGIAAAVAVYALAGFVLAPWLIARELPGMVREALGREASVGRVEVNPFALSLRAQDFRLADKDGSALAGLEELVVNLEAESLIRRAFTFSELGLRGPYLNVVRDRDGGINLLELAPPAAGPEPGAAESSGLPRLIVRRFRLEQGRLDFTDHVPAESFRTRVGPFDVALDELSTLPDAQGRHAIAVTLESGTRIGLAGEVIVNPLRVNGRFTLDGPFLGTVHRYVKDQIPFDVAGGESHIEAGFDVVGRPDGSLEARIADLGALVKDVRLTAPSAPDFLGFAELSLMGGEVRWPASEASLQSLRLRGLKVKARREANGEIDLAALLEPKATAAEPAQAATAAMTPQAPEAAAPAQSPAPQPEAASGAWKVRIAEAALEDMAVDFTDAGPATPATLAIADLDLTLRDLTNEPGARFPLDLAVTLGGGGTVKAQGTVAALPGFALDADLAIEGVKLAQAQPYVSDVARIGLRDGALAVDGHVVSDDKDALAFEGDLRVTALDTYDMVRKERLLAWNELAIDDLQLSLAGNGARIARVRLTRPFGRLFIARDQSTNVGALIVEDAAAAGEAPAPATAPGAAGEKPFRVRVGRILVSRGEVDFTDQSLPLPFAARIEDMKGEFTTIDTRSAAPSRIQLEGRVGEFGLARVDGEVRVSAPTDLAEIGVLFRNIEMAPYSPYTVKFAGRKIARGKINLDLRYQLTDRKMVGANKVVIDELELGEKVPNPDAMDLPLGLAVALLKDANGRIDIDMPVSGSLDDPEFGIGKVLWKAFFNLISKIVTSPFRLLGSLIGVESEDLGRIEFPPGRADLLPPEKEKLARVAEALGKRPELGVEIPAAVDPEADAAVLRTAKMQAAVDAALGEGASGRGLERRTRKVVEELFTARFPAESLDEIEARFVAPPPEEPEGRPRLDELAYLDELRARIASAETVSEEELAALGTARAAAIGGELTTAGQVAPERVRIGARKDVEARDGAWVPAELGVGGATE